MGKIFEYFGFIFYFFSNVLDSSLNNANGIFDRGIDCLCPSSQYCK